MHGSSGAPILGRSHGSTEPWGVEAIVTGARMAGAKAEQWGREQSQGRGGPWGELSRSEVTGLGF